MAKAIMIQGTASNVGKSLVVAGLCRIFHQDGYRVAPFKSQNMALNSYITKEGLEMGRAQVMQAEAAGIEPSVLMNPILLKPTTDTGSQVIVNGEVLGNLSAREYYRRKKEFIPAVLDAYQKLCQQNDIIVIEGAGSPAEINLKQDDIVNMGLAQLVKSPVLLVGDIDRGGVFASLAGTLLLLEESERQLVKGMIINKFRGDVGILKPGLDMIEEITQKSVLGVLPYLSLDVCDEDSLSERLNQKEEKGLLDIAIIRLPRISNFTDFDVLTSCEEIGIRYVTTLEQLKNPDMIILPGTKNTMEDLLWLRQSGLEAGLLKQASRGTVLFGICGGFQMLGEELCDPDNMEHGGTLRGMGLLPMVTTFQKEKTRTQIEGTFGEVTGILSQLSQTPVQGYEIHMGQSKLVGECDSFGKIEQRNGESSDSPLGYCRGNIYGSYVHGILDGRETVESLMKSLAEWKGINIEYISSIDPQEYKKKQYNKLADSIRESLDMKRIYAILEKGVAE